MGKTAYKTELFIYIIFFIVLSVVFYKAFRIPSLGGGLLSLAASYVITAPIATLVERLL